MENLHNTESLRSLAPHWSLAGDNKLLEILQNTHKQIISKCQEVNTQLSEMTATLDDASVSLQNVNNKFMALSNSQFIESRVYDDDADVTIEPALIKEPPKTVTQDTNISMLRKSLEVLESMHELVTILRDSDTESDTDDDDVARVVLKPKDLYADRPLPYIIGSQAWKNKWHAGLIVEDSDSDSTTSKQEKHSSEYSDSEPEDSHVQTDKPDVTISETSSELASEQDIPPHIQPNKQTPSDIAAELARRLGGQPTVMVNPEPDLSPPVPTVKTVYKPQQPPTGTIFSDEPPPIDNYESDSSQEDDDIFAELHKNKPQIHSDKNQIRVNEDLFGIKSETQNVGREIFNDFTKEQVLTNTTAKQKPALFDDESEPELFADNVQSNQMNVESTTDKTVKKPVGGISVFGTNKGAESIGAAIMKRNARKSSTSDGSGGEDQITTTQTKSTDIVNAVKKEKDIFDNLFAKAEKKETNKAQQNVKEVKAKVDLFSDNIFDDIDDIFSTNVVKINNNETKNNQKSIFDDNDDLFADISVTNIVKTERTSSDSQNKGLFDSDDELFSEKSTKIDDKKSTNVESLQNENKQTSTSKKIEESLTEYGKNIETSDHGSSTSKIIEITKPLNDLIKNTEPTKVTKDIKSIFDSDSDSDVFSHINIKKTKVSPKSMDINKTDTQEVIIDNIKQKPQDDVIKKDKLLTLEINKMQTDLKIDDKLKRFKSPSLFDDDDDDLFNDSEKSNIGEENIKQETNKISELQQDPKILSEITALSSKESLKQIISNKKISNPDETIIENKVLDNTSETTVLEKHNEIATNKEELDVNSHLTNIPPEHIQSKANVISESLECEAEQKVPKTLISINSDFHSEQTEKVLIPEQKDLFSNENIFGDIVSEPPAFEKPKEPKRSKNVNALFDDDSDDEALFFRKSDVIDDKPDDFSPSIIQDNLFGIFHDEPPAIDIDFTSKSEEIHDNVDTLNDSDSELFSSISKLDKKIAETEKVASYAESKNSNVGNKSDMVSSLYNDEKHKPQSEQAIPHNIVENSVYGNVMDKDNFHDIFDTESFNETDTLFIATTKHENRFSVVPNTLKESEKVDLDSNENAEIPKSSIEQVQKSPGESKCNDSDEEWFSTLTKPERPQSTSKSAEIIEKQILFNESHNSNENIFISIKGEEKRKEEQVLNDDKINNFVSDLTISAQEDNSQLENKETNILENTQSKSDLQQRREEDIVDFGRTKSSDIKKIGRIKSMNFNIDVNALLPGASPKKQKLSETIIRNEENKEKLEVIMPDHVNKTTDESINVESVESEPKLVKSISFESEPNSEILDNKASKERAKIQVKRRPSTRRARREAARKSVIDIDDSTDNSSSIDDAPKPVNTEKEIDSLLVQKNLEKPKVTSKIVYILNDEDIFDTKPDSKEVIDKNVIEKYSKEIFKPETNSTDIIADINTLGKSYTKIGDIADSSSDNSKNGTNIFKKEIIVNKDVKKSIFDQLSDDDDELFDTNKKTTTKPSIFDSDDDNNIFTGKSNIKVLKKDVVQGSLFGDDEDNNLFGVKTRIVDSPKTQTSKPSTSAKEATKSTEIVFEDPLSMLGNDD